jgi:hypothetical protein
MRRLARVALNVAAAAVVLAAACGCQIQTVSGQGGLGRPPYPQPTNAPPGVLLGEMEYVEAEPATTPAPAPPSPATTRTTAGGRGAP